ncbi:tyrosine-type recombinase/integrase [Blautia sp.]|uniref:tyrosine-type recombinase/integrase n=1 Tax=Blautia sp. TaxID=1955243 RepID=UPI00258B9E2D|nr:tyrosine-type recombinase/integrase [Blautia sp.]
MEHKIYLHNMSCYERAEHEQKSKVKDDDCFDLNLLPTVGLKEEFYAFLMDRDRQMALATIAREKNLYKRFCRILNEKHICVESLQVWDIEKWLLKIRAWLMEHGEKLTLEGVSVYGKEKIVPSALITYFRKIYYFTQQEQEQDEIEKDVWDLNKIDINYKKNPIKNFQTINFTEIIQPDLREETKKAVYWHLQYEAIATIIKELTAVKRLSNYLAEKYRDIVSSEEINREILEEYLIYLRTETTGVKSYKADLTRLRALVETIGKLYGYEHLEKLFLSSDIPRLVQPEMKSYSDSELIRLNAGIAKLDEQADRIMVIHQMLGTRISDTLTLQTDCLYRHEGHPMIKIQQMKTNTYVKPISAELELLIQKAIEYTQKKYGKTVYIFVDDKNPMKPMQYNALQNRVMDIIFKMDLRDDKGELFGFGTHMFRHVYGIRLTEMHLDDWTIAKLLGHKTVRNVKYYRKMSLQIIADETREVREEMSRMIRANLAGWGEEYEQI